LVLPSALHELWAIRVGRKEDNDDRVYLKAALLCGASCSVPQKSLAWFERSYICNALLDINDTGGKEKL
jgi:hypothetical protein